MKGVHASRHDPNEHEAVWPILLRTGIYDDLNGTIDIHCHPHPDFCARLLEDRDLVALAKATGMRAVMLKSHFSSTHERAHIAEAAVGGGIRVFGLICLNPSVGGFNPMAVETLAALMVYIPMALSQTTSRLHQVQQSGLLRVGMTGDYQPMTYRDPNTREFVGHQVDVAHELANDLGVQVEFVPTDWKTIINGLVSDKYDIAMSGTSMSLARARTVGMINSWGINAFVPIVRQENADKYKTWDDLNAPERTAGVTLGTTMEDFIRAELPAATMRRVEAPGSGWQEVLAGRVDYTISSMIEASALAQIHPDLALIFTDQPRNAIPMTFLVPIEDHVWIHFLNNWVYLKLTAGYFDELNEKWNLTLRQ